MRLNLTTLYHLTLMASALFMLRAELPAFAVAGSQAAIHDLPVRPFSVKAYHAVLMRCDRAMAIPLARLQPEARQRATAKACGAFAAATTAAMPTHGFAHLIAARVAGAEGNKAAQSAHLARSVEFAPFEGWLAERRFVLAANTDEFEKKFLRPDAAALLTTQSGAEMLSRYYYRRPGLRGLVTDTLDQAKQSDRHRFFNLLNKIGNLG